MKKKVGWLVLIAFVLFGCSEVSSETSSDEWLNSSSTELPEENVITDPRAEVGDIIYFKLDSAPCVVNYVRTTSFDIYYKNKREEYVELSYVRDELFLNNGRK